MMLHASADSRGSVVDVRVLVRLQTSSYLNSRDRTRTGRGQRVRCRRILRQRGHVVRQYILLTTASRGTSTDELTRTAAGQSRDDSRQHGELSAPAPFLYAQFRISQIHNAAKLRNQNFVYKLTSVTSSISQNSNFLYTRLYLVHEYHFIHY